MNKNSFKIANEPASPICGYCVDASGALSGVTVNETGLTKRELIAAMVLQGFASDSSVTGSGPSVAAAALHWTDSLIEALANSPVELTESE